MCQYCSSECDPGKKNFQCFTSHKKRNAKEMGILRLFFFLLLIYGFLKVVNDHFVQEFNRKIANSLQVVVDDIEENVSDLSKLQDKIRDNMCFDFDAYIDCVHKACYSLLCCT